MLLACGDALEKVGCIICVLKEKARQAVLHFKSVEELAVLVVLEIHIKLLIPKNTARTHYIDQLQEECVANKIVSQHNGSYQASICPLRGVRISNVKTRNGGIYYLVRGLGHGPLDFLFVCGCEYAHRWYFL